MAAPLEATRAIRALLLTDVVDSTRLAQGVGDERMAEIWYAHDRAVRDLMVSWRGLEIDRTDGFLVMFEQVSDALGFGMAVRAALAEVGERFGVPFAARVGIHWGPVILLETSEQDRALGAKPLEVEGLAKPLAARVMSLAAGGQVLLTAEARAQLGAGVAVESHGHWHMKGVSEPVELFEVVSPGAPLSPPPDSSKVYRVVRSGDQWLPAREVPHKLPVERDDFVGRRDDLHALAADLDDGARLVSVLGLGGAGKTRLVVRYGRGWLGDWPGGVWFCDVSEARDLTGVVTAVAAALDLALSQRDAVDQLGHAIAARGRCLVILDNFEQVGRYALATVGVWLDRAAEAAFVVTTREVLGLAGERVLALPPLEGTDAVDLFRVRARAANRDYVDDPDAVAELVALLDHLPLAIELAAARARVLTPRRLVERMSERFRLLVAPGARRDRQATLRATLDWSWGLLSEDEQRGLAQLSVFEGGFDLGAAETVLALDEAWADDLVLALVDKSLVRRAGEGDRLDLLVSVQEYAREHLTAEERAGAEERHAAWFAAHVEAAARHPDRVVRLIPDRSNLEVALERSLARGDSERAVALWLDGLDPLLENRGPRAERFRIGERLARLPDLRPERARLLRIRVASSLLATGQPAEARDRLSALVDEATRAEDHAALALAHHYRSNVIRVGSPAEALEDERRAVALARTHAPSKLPAMLCGLGLLALRCGDREEAKVTLLEAVDLARAAGELAIEAGSLCNLALLDMEANRHVEAEALLLSALDLARRAGSLEFEANIRGNLGLMAHRRGRFQEGIDRMREVLATHRHVGDKAREADTLHNLAAALAIAGQRAQSATVYDELRRLGERCGMPRAESDGLRGVALNRSLSAGRVRQALDELGRARALLGEDAPHSRCSCSQGIAACLGHLGQRDARVEALREARSEAERGGFAYLVGEVELELANLDPDPGSGEARARALAEQGRAAGLQPAERSAVMAVARRALDRGDPAEAEAWVDRGDALGADPMELAELRARLALARGDRTSAEAELDRLVAAARESEEVLDRCAALRSRWHLLGDRAALVELRALLAGTDLPPDAPLCRDASEAEAGA